MKTVTLIFGCLSLSLSTALAADDNYLSNETPAPQTGSVEDLANRLNVIKPDQYIEIVAESQKLARDTAKQMSKKETNFMIGLQNRLNKDMARRNNEPEPKEIKIDPNDQKAVEKMLTPDIYTYDDAIPNIE